MVGWGILAWSMNLSLELSRLSKECLLDKLQRAVVLALHSQLRDFYISGEMARIIVQDLLSW